MNEKETRSFRIAYDFYEKWRGTIIETQEQWDEFAADVGKLNADLDTDNNPLGSHLMMAVVETINDLYKDGKKPIPSFMDPGVF